MDTYSKDLLSKMDYLRELVELVRKQPLSGANHNVVYEAVWSVDYLNKVIPKVSDGDVKDTLLLYKGVIESFLSSVNLSEVDRSGSDEAKLVKLKYTENYGGVPVTARKINIAHIFTLLSMIGVCTVGSLVLFNSNELMAYPLLQELLRIMKPLCFIILLLLLVLVIVRTCIALCYIAFPFVQMILEHRLPQFVAEDIGQNYDRELRNTEWLEILSRDSNYKSIAKNMQHRLDDSKGLEYYKELIKIENLYVEYSETGGVTDAG